MACLLGFESPEPSGYYSVEKAGQARGRFIIVTISIKRSASNSAPANMTTVLIPHLYLSRQDSPAYTWETDTGLEKHSITI